MMARKLSAWLSPHKYPRTLQWSRANDGAEIHLSKTDCQDSLV